MTINQLAAEIVKGFYREEFGDDVLYTSSELREFIIESIKELYPDRSSFDSGEKVILLRTVISRVLAKEIWKRTHTAVPTSEPDRGSLQNIVAFENALAVAVRARLKLLNQRGPLPYDGAVDWLRNELDQANRLIDVSITVRIPLNVFREIDWGGVIGGNHTGLFRTLHQGKTKYWGGTVASQSVSTADGHRIFLESGKLVDLKEYASRIERWCGGFERGVWFILAGFWWRRGVVAHPRLGDDSRVVLDVGELETTPKELSEFYADMRSKIGYGRRGRKLSRRVEVLARIALEVEYIEHVGRDGREFYSRVLERWRQRALGHGLNPHAYSTPDSIRRVLQRIRAAVVNRPDSISRPGAVLAEWLKKNVN